MTSSPSNTYCSTAYSHSTNIAVIIVPVVLGMVFIIIIAIVIAIRNKRRLSKAKKFGEVTYTTVEIKVEYSLIFFLISYFFEKLNTSILNWKLCQVMLPQLINMLILKVINFYHF